MEFKHRPTNLVICRVSLVGIQTVGVSPLAPARPWPGFGRGSADVTLTGNDDGTMRFTRHSDCSRDLHPEFDVERTSEYGREVDGKTLQILPPELQIFRICVILFEIKGNCQENGPK